MKDLLEKFQIVANDKSLFTKALTHSSYINEHQAFGEDLEKLEFMGDAVLQLFVSELIYKFSKAKNEGEMSLLRSNLVRRDSLYLLAKQIDLGRYIFLGAGEDKSGGRDRKNILADAFESFIGAIYLDQGHKKAQEIVSILFKPLIKKIDYDDLIDYKTKLQEIIQSDTRKTIQYKEISKTGNSNNPFYEFAVILDEDIELARGGGTSKKAAQQEAARKALEKCAS